MDNYDILCSRLNAGFIDFGELDSILDNNLNIEANLEVLHSFGIPLIINERGIKLDIDKDIYKNTYCIVDIETNGLSKKEHSIIEIAAIKWSNGEIIDKFESYIACDEISPLITEITGISADMLIDAPSLKNVLMDFKIFLGDCVFMAHNASFDFNFINQKLDELQLPIMRNPIICTLALSRKSIISPKHGLSYLNEFLGINYPVRHRAYADCVIALKVFEMSLLNIELKSLRELIEFATIKLKKSKE